MNDGKENTSRYYNYSFKCPTKGYSGEIKNFPHPLDENSCPMCHRPKGSGDGECGYELTAL